MFNLQRPLSEHETARLRAILESPHADQVVRDAEATVLAQRRDAGKQIAESERVRPAEAARLQKDAAEKLRHWEDLIAQGHEAREAYFHAAQLEYGHAHGCDQRIGDLKKELERTSDPRLKDFVFELGQLRSVRCPLALEHWVTDSGRRGWGQGVQFGSNAEEIGAARELLDTMIARCHSLALKALSSAEVSEELGNMCLELAPALAKFDTNPPCLTAAQHLVGPPDRWNGSSNWIVESLPEPQKPERSAPPEVKTARASLDQV